MAATARPVESSLTALSSDPRVTRPEALVDTPVMLELLLNCIEGIPAVGVQLTTVLFRAF